MEIFALAQGLLLSLWVYSLRLFHRQTASSSVRGWAVATALALLVALLYRALLRTTA